MSSTSQTQKTINKIVFWVTMLAVVIIIIVFMPKCGSDRNSGSCAIPVSSSDTKTAKTVPNYGPAIIRLGPGEITDIILTRGEFFEWNCPTDGFKIRVFQRNGMPFVSRNTDPGGWVLRISNCIRYQCWLKDITSMSVHGIQFGVPTNLSSGVEIQYTRNRM